MNAEVELNENKKQIVTSWELFTALQLYHREDHSKRNKDQHIHIFD